MVAIDPNSIKTAKDLLEIAKEISSWLKDEKYESLRIDCMNYIGTYTATVTKKRFNPFNRDNKKIFDANLVYEIKVYSLKPMYYRVYDAVYRENNLVVLDLSKLNTTESYRIEINYNMNYSFLEGLVRGRSSPEPLDDSTKYHLVAQLKDPESLNAGFSEVDIEEFPVSVDVQMKEHINTNIAPFLKKLTIAEGQLLQFPDDKNVKEIIRLKKEQNKLKREGGKKDVSEWINNIRLFLEPRNFLHYIDRDKSNQFRLHDCQWGNLFQAFGVVPLPEKMQVINRTDLTQAQPAKSGEIIYKSQQFSDEFKGIFKKIKKP